MFNLSANISLMFQEFPFLERIGAAACSGFRAVEVMYPYEFSAHDMAEKMRSWNVMLSVLNAPPGDYMIGERGLAALPGRVTEFRDSLKQAIEYANTTQCTNIHVLTGNLHDDIDQFEVMSTLRSNLLYCAELFAENGVTLLLEPLSTQILPSYSLTRIEDASYWLRELGNNGFRNVGIQMDLYHTQMEQGNLAQLIKRYFNEITYIQIAGVPGRHEPTVGEINYRYLLNEIRELGFKGWVGCEYIPEHKTDIGLKWAREWGLLTQQNSCISHN